VAAAAPRRRRLGAGDPHAPDRLRRDGRQPAAHGRVVGAPRRCPVRPLAPRERRSVGTAASLGRRCGCVSRTGGGSSNPAGRLILSVCYMRAWRPHGGRAKGVGGDWGVLWSEGSWYPQPSHQPSRRGSRSQCQRRSATAGHLRHRLPVLASCVRPCVWADRRLVARHSHRTREGGGRAPGPGEALPVRHLRRPPRRECVA